MRISRIVFCALVLFFSALSFGQKTDKPTQEGKRIGFGLTPIVNIATTIGPSNTINNSSQLGLVFTGIVGLGKKTDWTYGLGFLSNFYKSSSANSFFEQNRNSLVVQSGFYQRFFTMEIVKECQINSSFGITAIYQNGTNKREYNVTEVLKTSFSSLVLAPALKTEIVITKYLSINTQIGVGVSLLNFGGGIIDNSFIKLRPLQKTDLLGQIGFTGYL